jgi:hypothetical protein
MEEKKIIIYNTDDGKTSVCLMTRDGNAWLNQNYLSELFDTSVPNISMHISNILKEGELNADSVIKDYLTTASDGKNYNVTYYSLDTVFNEQRKIYELQQADAEDANELKQLETSIKKRNSRK